MRKPTICIGENKDADQLRSNCEADQRLCFRYTDSTISLLLKSKILSFQPASVTVQPGLCRTWSETQIVGFLTHRLICCKKWCSIIGITFPCNVYPLKPHFYIVKLRYFGEYFFLIFYPIHRLERVPTWNQCFEHKYRNIFFFQ